MKVSSSLATFCSLLCNLVALVKVSAAAEAAAAPPPPPPPASHPPTGAVDYCACCCLALALERQCHAVAEVRIVWKLNRLQARQAR